MIGIYKITSPTNKVYIGQSWYIETRKSSYKKCRPRQPFIYNSIKKYGWESHKFEVIHELPSDVTQEILDRYEKLYIELYKSCGVDLMNIREAGSRGKHSEESKQKVSKGNKGKQRTEDFKKNVSIQMKGNKYSLGFKNTLESNEKKRIALLGRPVSEETRNKIRKSVKKSWQKRREKCL